MGIESVYKGWNDTTPHYTSLEPALVLASILAAALHSFADHILRCCSDFAHSTNTSDYSSASQTISNIWDSIMFLSLSQFPQAKYSASLLFSLLLNPSLYFLLCLILHSCTSNLPPFFFILSRLLETPPSLLVYSVSDLRQSTCRAYSLPFNRQYGSSQEGKTWPLTLLIEIRPGESQQNQWIMTIDLWHRVKQWIFYLFFYILPRLDSRNYSAHS